MALWASRLGRVYAMCIRTSWLSTGCAVVIASVFRWPLLVSWAVCQHRLVVSTMGSAWRGPPDQASSRAGYLGVGGGGAEAVRCSTQGAWPDEPAAMLRDGSPRIVWEDNDCHDGIMLLLIKEIIHIVCCPADNIISMVDINWGSIF